MPESTPTAESSFLSNSSSKFREIKQNLHLSIKISEVPHSYGAHTEA